MEESANIEFLYRGCLPLQPGSQLSHPPALGRCRPRFLWKRFQRARIIIAEGSGNVNSFFGFFRKLLKGEPVRAAVPGAARKRHAGESMSCRSVPRHEGGEKSGFPFAPGVREGRFFAALRMTTGGNAVILRNASPPSCHSEERSDEESSGRCFWDGRIDSSLRSE